MNTQNTRRNSFSSFVKNLILLVSPSHNEANEDLKLERSTTSESSPFQDMYFSFPAFEETYEDSNCGHPSTFISSSIVC